MDAVLHQGDAQRDGLTVEMGILGNHSDSVSWSSLGSQDGSAFHAPVAWLSHAGCQ